MSTIVLLQVSSVYFVSNFIKIGQCLYGGGGVFCAGNEMWVFFVKKSGPYPHKMKQN